MQPIVIAGIEKEYLYVLEGLLLRFAPIRQLGHYPRFEWPGLHSKLICDC